jgi:hypothetical protein
MSRRLNIYHTSLHLNRKSNRSFKERSQTASFSCDVSCSQSRLQVLAGRQPTLIDVETTCTIALTDHCVGIRILFLLSVGSDHLAGHWYKFCASNGLTEEGNAIAVPGN